MQPAVSSRSAGVAGRGVRPVLGLLALDPGALAQRRPPITAKSTPRKNIAGTQIPLAVAAACRTHPAA